MSTLTNEDAKGCPFCGGLSTVEEINTGAWSIGCNDCDYRLMSGPVGIGWYRSEHIAVKTWNERNSDYAMERANDFLKDSTARLSDAQAEIARLRGALEKARNVLQSANCEFTANQCTEALNK